MATFPSGVKTFSDRTNGETITDAMFDEPGAEVTAIETFLRSSLFSAVTSGTSLPVATAFTPTWASSTLGDGTLTGSYLGIGDLVLFTITLTIGATTSPAGTAWTFAPPLGTIASGGGCALLVDSGGANNNLAVMYKSAAGTFSFYTDEGSFVSSTAPFTWATGDSFQAFGFYFRAS